MNDIGHLESHSLASPATGVRRVDLAPEKRMARTAANRAAPDFRAVFEFAPRPLLLVKADPPRYTMVAANRAHGRAFGATAASLVGKGVFEAFGDQLSPDMAALLEAIRDSFAAALETGEPHQMSARRYLSAAANGGERAERYLSAVNSPLRNPSGQITHILSATQDVTGEVLERRNEELQHRLMREIDHRARNSLTIAQSFVRLTTAATVADFRDRLEGRIAALARAQTSLATKRWRGALIGEIVALELNALTDHARYKLEGESVLLPPDRAQALSMIVHELATNASKYGCLSRAGGKLLVSWSTDGGRTLRLRWDERAGPTVSAATPRGFGTRLITRLAAQQGGAASFDWRPAGLMVALSMPVAADQGGCDGLPASRSLAGGLSSRPSLSG